jgi:hypothetical protein
MKLVSLDEDGAQCDVRQPTIERGLRSTGYQRVLCQSRREKTETSQFIAHGCKLTVGELNQSTYGRHMQMEP